MTLISFHHDLPDTQAYLLRLLRQLSRKATPVAVVGALPQLQTLSQHLWQQSEPAFLAHALPHDGPAVQQYSLLQLCTALKDAQQQDLAVNLCPEVPDDFARFHKIIELVGTPSEVRLAARERLRYYKGRGYAIDYYPYKHLETK